jgi:hypothetical protein
MSHPDWIFHAEEWPHGLTCAECSHEFKEGERYGDRFESFEGDSPVLLIVCPACERGEMPA